MQLHEIDLYMGVGAGIAICGVLVFWLAYRASCAIFPYVPTPRRHR